MNKSPRFMCDSCGYANVKLAFIDGTVGAHCTECGKKYIEEDPMAINTDD